VILLTTDLEATFKARTRQASILKTPRHLNYKLRVNFQTHLILLYRTDDFRNDMN